MKTDAAFSAAGALSHDKPKPAPEKTSGPKPADKPKKKSGAKTPEQEMELLLQAEPPRESCWICRCCSVENQTGITRCVVCGQIK